jgi:hypothetical protein
VLRYTVRKLLCQSGSKANTKANRRIQANIKANVGGSKPQGTLPTCGTVGPTRDDDPVKQSGSFTIRPGNARHGGGRTTRPRE